MNRRTNQLCLWFALAAVLVMPCRATAHDLKILVDLEGDPIKVEAWFDGPIPAQNARAALLNASGEEVLSGTTDDRGVWTFPRPAPGTYRVVVEQAGHRDLAKFTIPGAAESQSPTPGAVSNPRPDQNIGLILGLVLLLGGTAGFIVIRRLKRPHEPITASTSPPL